jgi:hypothetical protein
MQGLQQSYTQYFNRKHHKVGSSVSGSVQSHSLRKRWIFISVGALHTFKSDQGEARSSCTLKAMNLRDDADTTALICYQLAGAFYGESGIPKEMAGGSRRSPTGKR